MDPLDPFGVPDFAAIWNPAPGDRDLTAGVGLNQPNDDNDMAVIGKAAEGIGGAPWAPDLSQAPGAARDIFGFDDALDLPGGRGAAKITPAFDGALRLQQIAGNGDSDGIALKDGPTDRRRKALVQSISRGRPGTVPVKSAGETGPSFRTRLDVIGFEAATGGNARNRFGVPFGLPPLKDSVGPRGRNRREDVRTVQRGLKRVGFFPASKTPAKNDPTSLFDGLWRDALGDWIAQFQKHAGETRDQTLNPSGPTFARLSDQNARAQKAVAAAVKTATDTIMDLARRGDPRVRGVVNEPTARTLAAHTVGRATQAEQKKKVEAVRRAGSDSASRNGLGRGTVKLDIVGVVDPETGLPVGEDQLPESLGDRKLKREAGRSKAETLWVRESAGDRKLKAAAQSTPDDAKGRSSFPTKAQSRASSGHTILRNHLSVTGGAPTAILHHLARRLESIASLPAAKRAAAYATLQKELRARYRLDTPAKSPRGDLPQVRRRRAAGRRLVEGVRVAMENPGVDPETALLAGAARLVRPRRIRQRLDEEKKLKGGRATLGTAFDAWNAKNTGKIQAQAGNAPTLTGAAATAADRRFLRNFHSLRHDKPLAAVRAGIDHASATGRLRFTNVLSVLTQRAMRDGVDPQGFIAALDAARRLRATRPDVYARLPEILRTQADMLRFTNQRLGPLGPNATPDDLARRTRHIQRILSQKTEWKDAALAMAGAAFGGRGGGRRPGGGRRNSATRPKRRSGNEKSATTRKPEVVGDENIGDDVELDGLPTGLKVGDTPTIRRRGTGAVLLRNDKGDTFPGKDGKPIRLPEYEVVLPNGLTRKIPQLRKFDRAEQLEDGTVVYWRKGHHIKTDDFGQPQFEHIARGYLPGNLVILKRMDRRKHEKYLYQDLFKQGEPVLRKLGLTPRNIRNLERGNTPEGYTWHHHPIVGRSDLVPNEPHKSTYHYGGMVFWANPKSYSQ